jgi:3',5'-cyclic AMP phosphodiesterase CpdA
MKLILQLIAAFLLMPQNTAAQTRIAVASDIHVMAPSLLPDEAKKRYPWMSYYASQRKMLEQSADLFDQLKTTLLDSKPDILFITGDLTKDGEQASHDYVKAGLETLRDAGIKVLVIPGNHDFGGEGNHKQFTVDGTTTDVPVLAASDFATYYADYGYTGSTTDPNGSLSYVAEPENGLVVLAIDSHTATIGNNTLTWLCDQAKAAHDDGKQVIAMMHHPLFPHVQGLGQYISTYAVDGYETIRNSLIEAGVSVILTGHFHTSDIAKDWNDNPDKAIYDINTGSLISYPCDYRMLTLSKDRQQLSISTATLTPTGMTEEDSKSWLKTRLKTLIKAKINSSKYASFFTQQSKEHYAEIGANAFILHAEGDEHTKEDAATILGEVDEDNILKLLLGKILHSMLEDKSNYGDPTHEDQTDDRTLTIDLSQNEKTAFIKGDANGDHKVDIADIVEVVNFLDDKPSSHFNKQAADANDNGIIDPNDITAISSIILTPQT